MPRAGWPKPACPPAAIAWQVEGETADLFAGPDTSPPPAGPSFAVPRGFVDLAKKAICHSDPERFALLYAMLLKLRANRRAMEDRADPLLDRLERMAKEVRRDLHKMHAFVRFREVERRCRRALRRFLRARPSHRPRHRGLLRAPLHRDALVDPDPRTVDPLGRRDARPKARARRRGDAPDGDPVEAVWKTYYASIFNPARVKVKAMTKEMPKKYWKNMPETALIGELLAGAQKREAAMIETSRSQEPMPRSNLKASWEALRAEAAACTRCDLYKCATQTVFGEGPLDPAILFVGEQPGDQEDLAGRPFVGPAGQLFDAALAEAGIDRATTYVTNAVKHFKFVARGKRRIHAKPDGGEIDACRWWIEQERELIRPPLTVALGATAARSLIGKVVTISKVRGAPLTLADGSAVLGHGPPQLPAPPARRGGAPHRARRASSPTSSASATMPRALAA